jgi:hypothetical protein
VRNGDDHRSSHHADKDPHQAMLGLHPPSIAKLAAKW